MTHSASHDLSLHQRVQSSRVQRANLTKLEFAWVCKSRIFITMRLLHDLTANVTATGARAGSDRSCWNCSAIVSTSGQVAQQAKRAICPYLRYSAPAVSVPRY